MKWFWVNFYMDKKERVYSFVFVGVLIILVSVKAYLHFFYTPKLPIANRSQLDNIVFTKPNTHDAPIVREPKNHPSTTVPIQKKTPIEKSSLVTMEEIPTLPKFAFDPNTITIDSFQLLGFSTYAANNLARYRENNGIFYSSEKLKMIFGVDTSLVETLADYMSFPPKPERKHNVLSAYHSKIIDINNSDTSDWIQLKGIGPYYSKMIVNYRNYLGGFYHIDQVAETYNLPDSTFQAIKPFLRLDSTELKKKNINAIPFEQLVMHPYVSGKTAKILIAYRKMHGPFEDIMQLKEIKPLSEGLIDTLSFYFATE